MKYLVICLLALFLGCEAYNRSSYNGAAICTAECYEKCAKSCCSGELVEGIFLGQTPEDDLICECWVYTGELKPDAGVPLRKKLGVIVRKNKTLTTILTPPIK